MSNFNVEDILKQAEAVNSQIVKHNNENRKQEGIREATKKQIITQINEYNSKHGTNLSLDDLDSLQEEYVKAVKSIYNETKHLTEVINAVNNGNIKLVSELTGIDIEQDTIKMPVINIDMDEMEKQADKAYKQVEGNKEVIPTVFAFNGQDADDVEEIVEETEETEEGAFVEENEDSPSGTETNQGIRSFFDGVKVANQSEASKKENQTQENTTPNFSGIFGSMNANKDEQPKPEQKQSVPDFSSMFSGVKSGNSEPEKKEEKQDINSFLSNFNTSDIATSSKSSVNDKKIEDALKNQPKVPTFDFSSIDLDED